MVANVDLSGHERAGAGGECVGNGAKWCRGGRGVSTHRPDESEHLVRSGCVANASAPDAPGKAAKPVAKARVLPGRGRVGLHRPIGPAPLAIGSILPGLYRDPVRAGSEHGWHAECYLENASVINVWLADSGVHVRSRQASTILVEKHLERISRAKS